jgi:hypothetical protein
MFSQKSGSCHSRQKVMSSRLKGEKVEDLFVEKVKQITETFGYAKNGIHKNERKSNNENLNWFSNPFLYN